MSSLSCTGVRRGRELPTCEPLASDAATVLALTTGRPVDRSPSSWVLGFPQVGVREISRAVRLKGPWPEPESTQRLTPHHSFHSIQHLARISLSGPSASLPSAWV